MSAVLRADLEISGMRKGDRLWNERVVSSSMIFWELSNTPYMFGNPQSVMVKNEKKAEPIDSAFCSSLRSNAQFPSFFNPAKAT